MNLEGRISALSALGKYIENQSIDEFKLWSVNAQSLNSWFTEEQVKLSLKGILNYLNEQNLKNWLNRYNIKTTSPKNIGIVMAGNIPLVGFHDYLCALISGHYLTVKLSSQDNYLLPQLHKKLIEIEPFFINKVNFVDRLTKVDAYIATGSDNSARYFEYYFREKPNIIRKNRTSIAVINGDESDEDLIKLSDDVFSYFGLGCRNVTFLLVPEEYDWNNFLTLSYKYEHLAHHNKYRNNYEYSRSVLLVKQIPHLDNGFLLVKEDDHLHASISVLNFKTYKNIDQINSFLNQHKNKIQCIVGKGYTNFGNAQNPQLWDYADGVDTLDFLLNL